MKKKRKYTILPAVTGKQLINILKKEGWIPRGQATHGIFMYKVINSQKRETVIPNKNRPLPENTLNSILGEKQTGLGKKGLLELINKYGLK